MLGKFIFILYLASNTKMKKLFNLIIATVIGVIVLYVISLVIASIVLAVIFIVNRILAYRKKHRRFTDWEYKYNHHLNERVGSKMQIRRTFYFERLDRVTNTIEIKEDVKITPINDYDNLKAEEFSEWLAFKTIEKRFTDQKLKEYYSGV